MVALFFRPVAAAMAAAAGRGNRLLAVAVVSSLLLGRTDGRILDGFCAPLDRYALGAGCSDAMRYAALLWGVSACLCAINLYALVPVVCVLVLLWALGCIGRVDPAAIVGVWMRQDNKASSEPLLDWRSSGSFRSPAARSRAGSCQAVCAEGCLCARVAVRREAGRGEWHRRSM